MIVQLTRPSIARAAILPVAGMLSVITLLAVAGLASRYSAGATAKLLEKAALTARVIAPNVAAAAWNFDTQSGTRLLQSLESDPDYESGIIVDDKGDIFASSQRTTGIQPITPLKATTLLDADRRELGVSELREFVRGEEVIDILPLFTAARSTRNVGYMVLSFSRRRVHEAALHEAMGIAVAGVATLLALCALLAWILSRVTHPIREITGAMSHLSSGVFDTVIPALDRRDEIGAMARALAVFKENSIERQRLEFLTYSLQETTDALRREGEKVSHLAHHDPLTGLANRAQLRIKIERSRQALLETGADFAVFILDLDRFKEVNDSLGHAAGDTLLMAVALRLKKELREHDTLARLGGDEFAIIRPQLISPDDGSAVSNDSSDDATDLASRILRCLTEAFDISGNTVFVGCSIGIALAPRDGSEPEALMKAADLALYEAKAAGRNCFFFFEEKFMQVADERHHLEADMRVGLSRGEFRLLYQPIVNVATGKVIGAEALVRWQHPSLGLLTPNRFIHLAEESGLIVELGQWILERACQDAMTWPPDVQLAVNLSAIQLRNTSFLGIVRSALADSGLPPRRLELEVTETVLLDKRSNALSQLHQLRDIGIAIALDDFGTGYSSLSYLRAFPFDRIKIDRSFTKDIAERADCAAIVSSIVGLGRSLDIATTVEGVETEQQLELVRALGATMAQGYLIGKPIPSEALNFEGIRADQTVVAA
jgi:diguanylate cyclase (GGDEF)-like protein